MIERMLHNLFNMFWSYVDLEENFVIKSDWAGKRQRIKI